MSDDTAAGADADANPRTEAVQAVVDRLTSYQSTAPAGTIETRLREALAEAGVALPDTDVRALVGAVEGADGPVDVAAILG